MVPAAQPAPNTGLLPLPIKDQRLRREDSGLKKKIKQVVEGQGNGRKQKKKKKNLIGPQGTVHGAGENETI